MIGSALWWWWWPSYHFIFWLCVQLCRINTVHNDWICSVVMVTLLTLWFYILIIQYVYSLTICLYTQYTVHKAGAWYRSTCYSVDLLYPPCISAVTWYLFLSMATYSIVPVVDCIPIVQLPGIPSCRWLGSTSSRQYPPCSATWYPFLSMTR